MTELTPEQVDILERKTTLAIMTRGSEFPLYLEQYSVLERMVILNAMENQLQHHFDPRLKVMLLMSPKTVAEAIADNPDIKAKFDELGEKARASIAAWSPEENRELQQMAARMNAAMN